MHRSRLGGVIIDCETEDINAAAAFWSAALGWVAAPREGNYVKLETPPNELHVEIQKVTHPSRAHIDIETDDVEAEVRRLEGLGARRLEAVRTWVVMEAPTGQRFCVVTPQRSGFAAEANRWTDQDT